MRECVGKSALKMLAKVDASLMLRLEEGLKAEQVDEDAPVVLKRVSRMQPQPTRQVCYIYVPSTILVIEPIPAIDY